MDDNDKILQEYWYTDLSSSYSDISQSQSQSQSTDDQVMDVAGIFIVLVMKEVVSYGTSTYDKTPYHTSALTGEMWVTELLRGHPERIRNELGVHKHVFLSLCTDLHRYGHWDSKTLSLEEQLAIFLYTCVTGLSIQHVSERFQHATDTTSQYESHIFSFSILITTTFYRYFLKMLVIFSSPPLYTNFIRPPKVGDPVPEYIFNDPKLYPFFEDALGAINGSHFNAFAASDRDALCDRNGSLTTNALAICDFSMRFLHTQSGWEGSVANAQMFHDSRFTDLSIPDGKYFLADAGFPTCSTLLVPYRGAQYHLSEWGHTQLRYGTTTI